MSENYIRVGEFRCFPLTDGHLTYPQNALFPNRTDTEVAEAVAPEAVEPEIPVGYSGLLVDTGTQRILIDTGAGDLGPETGRLPESLGACGVTLEQIERNLMSGKPLREIGQ